MTARTYASAEAFKQALEQRLRTATKTVLDDSHNTRRMAHRIADGRYVP